MSNHTKRNQIDMLNGSMWGKIPLYALPVAATAILEQLFNASDIAIVGNFTGSGKTVAVAAVGANSPIIGLIINLFVGIALGCNVVIANAIGQENKERVSKAVHTSVIISVLGGVFIAALGEIIASPLLKSLQVPDDVFASALLYLRIYLLGMPVILLYNFESAIFRSIGETKTPLVALAVSGVLNVLLNLFFVAILHMTVNGVAIATVISNVVSSAILFIKLIKSEHTIKIEFSKLKIDGKILLQIIKIGLPAGIQGAVFAVANIVIQSAINSLGTIVMAASSAALNLEVFTYDILTSFGQACTTFTGQNYGAKKYSRCRQVLKISLLEGAITLVISIGIVFISGKYLLAIFNNDTKVIELGYTRLILVMSAHIFSLIYEVISGYLRGFGISLVPAILTTLGVCVVRIIWIKLYFPQHQTFEAILTAYPISLSLTAVLMFAAMICYRPTKKLINNSNKEN